MHGDMAELDFQREFDAVILWGNTFAMFEHERNVATLRGIAHALKKGGRALHKKPSKWTEKETRQVVRASHAELGLLSVDQQGKTFSRPKPKYYSPVSWRIIDDGSALVTCRCNKPTSTVKVVMTLENLQKIIKDVKGAKKASA